MPNNFDDGTKSNLKPNTHYGVWADSLDGIGAAGTSSKGPAVMGQSTNGVGVFGESLRAAGHKTVVDPTPEGGVGVLGLNKQESGIGVRGQADQGTGVSGQSETSIGVFGESTKSIAVLGVSSHGNGVAGKSTFDIGVVGQIIDPPKSTISLRLPGGVGVYGECGREGGIGVRGNAEKGTGVKGESVSGEGVRGNSETGTGVKGASVSGDGVCGEANTVTGIGVSGTGHKGVYGVSGGSMEYDDQGNMIDSGIGVYGRCINGVGVAGNAPYSPIVGTEPWPRSIGVTGAGNMGVHGEGVVGVFGLNKGVFGLNKSDTGVPGTGVHGKSEGSDGIGVLGESDGVGVHGEGVVGVFGLSKSDTGVPDTGVPGVGVHGKSEGSVGIGVLGESDGFDGVGMEAHGWVGIKGISENMGIWAEGSGDALKAVNPFFNFWAYLCTTYRAGDFYGDVDISGRLSKTGGQFHIDHPLDPAHKDLNHSFVESPDMKTVYDGIVVLDAKGTAKVKLPDWFMPLNRDFRYQLTPIGAAGPNLHIAEEEYAENSFQIAGGAPGMKVSWQVTGIRQDAWAEAHPMQVEEEKPPAERGHYLYPELHGAPAHKSIMRARHPESIKKSKN